MIRNDWVGWLRDAPWATRERVRAYAALALAAYGVLAALVLATSHDFVDLRGRPVGTDFANVWAAGRLALQGRAADAYDWQLHAAVEAARFGPGAPYYGWHYPPLFLLCAALLALLPYGLALGAWMVSTMAAYAALMRRLLPPGTAAWPMLALPATLVNLGHGQNGFFSTALLGFGLLLLDARPVAAGVLLGALGYKPQLAVLVPLALMAATRWRALAALAITLLALAALSAGMFGMDSWRAFAHSMALTQARVLEAGAAGTYKMVSVFAAIRLIGGGVQAAWIAQALASLGIAGVVFAAWRRPAPTAAKAALLAAALPLATPYAFDYDLAVLAIPVAWFVSQWRQGRALPWERTCVAAACLLPALARPIAWLAGIPLTPFVIAALLALVLRRLGLGSTPPAFTETSSS